MTVSYKVVRVMEGIKAPFWFFIVKKTQNNKVNKYVKDSLISSKLLRKFSPHLSI